MTQENRGKKEWKENRKKKIQKRKEEKEKVNEEEVIVSIWGPCLIFMDLSVTKKMRWTNDTGFDTFFLPTGFTVLFFQYTHRRESIVADRRVKIAHSFMTINSSVLFDSYISCWWHFFWKKLPSRKLSSYLTAYLSCRPVKIVVCFMISGPLFGFTTRDSSRQRPTRLYFFNLWQVRFDRR